MGDRRAVNRQRAKQLIYKTLSSLDGWLVTDASHENTLYLTEHTGNPRECGLNAYTYQKLSHQYYFSNFRVRQVLPVFPFLGASGASGATCFSVKPPKICMFG